MEYTKLMSVLDDCCDQKIPMIIYWGNGCIFKNSGNLGVSETDNGLDYEDEGYMQYYSCWVRIAEIMSPPDNSACDELVVGEGVEITDQNAPLKIETADGTLLWSKGDV